MSATEASDAQQSATMSTETSTSPADIIKQSMQKQQEQQTETPAVDAETGELFPNND
jgi:hypothetical protein